MDDVLWAIQRICPPAGCSAAQDGVCCAGNRNRHHRQHDCERAASQRDQPACALRLRCTVSVIRRRCRCAGTETDRLSPFMTGPHRLRGNVQTSMAKMFAVFIVLAAVVLPVASGFSSSSALAATEDLDETPERRGTPTNEAAQQRMAQGLPGPAKANLAPEAASATGRALLVNY